MATAEDSFASHKPVALHSRLRIPGADLAAVFLNHMAETPRGDLKLDFLGLKMEDPGPTLDVKIQHTKTETHENEPVVECLNMITEVERDAGVKVDHT